MKYLLHTFSNSSLNFSIRINTRKSLRGRSQSSAGERDHPLPVLFPDSYSRRLTHVAQFNTVSPPRSPPAAWLTLQQPLHSMGDGDPTSTKVSKPSCAAPPSRAHRTSIRPQLQISVEKTVQYDVDGEPSGGILQSP